jgi:C4-dicarboxylate transporter
MLEVLIGCVVVYVLVGYFLVKYFKITLDKSIKMWYKESIN